MTWRENVDIVLYLNLVHWWMDTISLEVPCSGPRVDLARQWEAEEAAADQNICFLANVALFPPFPPNLIQHPQHQGENIYWFGFKNV